MKKIVYLHGLESEPGGTKVSFLAEKGMVYAPNMDYVTLDLSEFIHTLGMPDLIIGSSIGGYVADIIGSQLGVDVLLFNPALHSRSFEPINNYTPKLGSTVHNVILGGKDDIIDCNKTCEYLNLNDIQYIKELIPGMTHRTPLNIFIDVVDKRINQLNTLSNITSKF